MPEKKRECYESCPGCGASYEKIVPLDDGNLECTACGRIIKPDSTLEVVKGISQDRQGLLFASIYNTSDEQLRIFAINIQKKISADDVQANLYLKYLAAMTDEVAEKSDFPSFINSLPDDVIKKNGEYIEFFLNFVLKRGMTGGMFPCLEALSEKLFRLQLIDIDQREKYLGELKKEKQHIDDGYYRLSKNRDVYVSYAYEDSEKALQIIGKLEEEGYECFSYFTNIHHSLSSHEDHLKERETAISHCRCFLFLSSKNSRQEGCKAFSLEIPYVRDHQRTSDGKAIKRIEFLLDDYGGEENRSAQRELETFFRKEEQVSDIAKLLSLLKRQTAFNQIGDYRTNNGANNEKTLQNLVVCPECRLISDFNKHKECPYCEKRLDGEISVPKFASSYQEGDIFDPSVYSSRGDSLYASHSYDEAVKWYRKGAAINDKYSQYRLGLCYENGYGAKKSLREAMRYYELAQDEVKEAKSKLRILKEFLNP